MLNIEPKYADVELAVARHFGTRKCIIVPNYYISWGGQYDHECDLFIIRSSGYGIEVEIKMSLSDTKAEAKKKHDHSHDLIKRLYYAFPKSISDRCMAEIPVSAGVLAIQKNTIGCYVELIREAQLTKARKLTIDEQLHVARLGVMRIWNLKSKYME